jgi:predicted MFS family arabinose efflux permease
MLSGILVTCGLALIVAGCSQAAAQGWSSTRVAAPGVAGLIAVAAFVVRQTRVDEPLLPLWVLAHRSRAGAYLAVAVSVVGVFGMFLILTYHFQVVLGFSPVRAGLAFLPMSLAVSASAYGLGSRLLPRLAPRVLMAPGLLLGAIGLAVLSTMTTDSGYLTTILPADVLVGVGMGLVFTPGISVATSEVEPRYAGVAAATANTAMQVGGSLGTAVLNSVAVSATASYVAAHGPGTVRTTALVHGFATAMTWSAVALAVTAALVVLLIRAPRPDQAAGQMGS